MEEYIKLLDLPDEFDFAILKKAYRKKVMIFHPDKAKDEAQRAEFETMMKKLNAANDYLKEYLERHDGKYTKPVEEDIKEEAEEEAEYYSDPDEYDETDSDEESDEVNDEYAELLSEDEIRNLSLSEIVKYVLKVLFTPRLLYLAFKKSNEERPCPKEGFIFLFIIFLLLMWYIITDSSKDTNNQIPKQEIVQDRTTDRQSPEDIPEPKKPLTLEEKAEINEYLENIQQQIKRNCDLPKNIMAEQGYDEVKVVVNFTVSKEGKLLSEPIIKESSGLAIVDSRCIEAIKLTAPFKPLPKCVLKDSVDIEFTFETKRH